MGNRRRALLKQMQTCMEIDKKKKQKQSLYNFNKLESLIWYNCLYYSV